LKALREAIVNALMHRSYKEHRPTQVIRYNNRIEIINPGFSLKSEEKLGQPGSETRNPFIAAVFHDTNLAETKGSGIRAMRRLMHEAHLVPPTFESSRENNEFTARLLLHHFLDEKDIEWLRQFEHFNLSDPQMQALIFVREVGAIDNQTYRQMADCDTLKASNDLRMLKTNGLFSARGKGKATYYIPGKGLNTEVSDALNTEPTEISTQPHAAFSTQPIHLSTPPHEISTPPSSILPDDLNNEIAALKLREHDSEKIKDIILRICEIKPMRSIEVAEFLGKREDYIKRKYLSKMIQDKELTYLYPDMINHPEQAYLTTKK
jgi:ATP-dependent DNA helicase RecG